MGMPTPEARDDYQEDRYERDRRNDREDDRQPIKRCIGVAAMECNSNLETGIWSANEHQAAIWLGLYGPK